MKLTSNVLQDDVTRMISKNYDYAFSGQTQTIVDEFPLMSGIPSDFCFGLIVGSSGSGKSTLLSKFGEEVKPEWWDDLCVASHFSTYEQAVECLGAVGLNSIPSWMRPYHQLSNGEQYRANLALMLENNKSLVIDEFTSVVDRHVAKSLSMCLSKYLRKNNFKNVVIASCHRDIIDWLDPDWVYDADTKVLSRRSLRQYPTFTIELVPCSSEAWSYFSKHHYLTEDIVKGASCWLATIDETIVGFTSCIAFPSGNIQNAWRGHRTVVLPEFQGMGIGVRISDAVGAMMLSMGRRYFSKTAHPRMGNYRNNSPLWVPTSKNMRTRTDYKDGRVSNGYGNKHKLKHAERFCYSHEFVGKDFEVVIEKPVSKMEKFLT